MKRSIRVVVAAVFLSSLLLKAQVLTSAEAKDHVGESATVCGGIASENTASSSRDAATFVSLDQPYPHQVFTVRVRSADKAAVGPIPKAGHICAKGTISLYRGLPEIVVHTSTDLYVPKLSNDRHYINSDGNTVHSPANSNGGAPAGSTALCEDGTYSFSQHRQGTCSHHGGVAKWL
jgi:Protein of unknown function (DUF3761)